MPKNQHAQSNFFKSYNELWFVKQCQNCTFKVNFGCQKLIDFFQKKNLSRNINLGDHYLFKTFFSKLNYWTTLLSKISPNFWQTVISRRNFLKIFPWWHVDSWPKTLLFRTHHLQNSTTELTLMLIFHYKPFKMKICLFQKWEFLRSILLLKRLIAMEVIQKRLLRQINP